jgi:hypothetical protein
VTGEGNTLNICMCLRAGRRTPVECRLLSSVALKHLPNQAAIVRHS